MKRFKFLLSPTILISFIFMFLSSVLYYGLMFTLYCFYIPVELGEPYSYKVLDINGNVIEAKLFNKPGRYVGLNEIPLHLQQALIAVEDHNFYQHHGYNLSRILQAGVINLAASSIKQGGSTITQQLARTLYLDTSPSFQRKVKELTYAIALEHKYSKQEILEAYLNSVYFGHNLYGVDQAARYFFNVGVEKLTLAQSALIAGLCSAPATNSPEVSPVNAKARQQFTLLSMFELGYIDASQYYQSLEEQLQFHFQLEQDIDLEKNYYLDAVRVQLDQLNILNKSNLVKGMVVETNIDLNISAKIQTFLDQQTFGENTQVAVVLMKTYSNQVLTLIGGSNYQKSQFNRAIQTRRPIGSAIKPLIYYLGLEKGMSPSSQFISEPSTYLVKNYGQFEIHNAGEKYAYRPVNMIEALGVSDNAYAAKTTLLVGSKNVANALSYFTDSAIEVTPNLAFGTAELTPLELASMYNTLASDGTYYKPQLIRRVLDYRGRTIYQSGGSVQELMNINSLTLLQQMMRAPFDENIAKHSYTNPTLINYQPNTTWAAKTGSTKSNSWVAAYNPHYTLVVYLGTDDNSVLEETSISKKLFVKIADAISKDLIEVWYPPTSWQVALKVNPVTLNSDANGSTYYFPR